MNYDLFIDESCHLEHDKISVMCIGYVKVPKQEYSDLYSRLEAIKVKNKTLGEIKWNKFSKSRLPLYKELVDYFIDSSIEFRAILVKYKDRLNNEDFNNGSHDNYYYKMIYYLLRPSPIIDKHRVFLDIKDTRGKQKLQKMNEVFHNSFQGDSPFIYFQHLRSHENVFFQLTDIFIGAITYKARVENGEFKEPNQCKMEFIKYLEDKIGLYLHEGTAPWETKFNIFDHQPKIQS